MGWEDWLLPAASPARFVARTRAALKRAGLGENIEIRVTGVLTSPPAVAGQGMVLNLDNLYRDYLNASRGDRGKVFDVIVEMARTPEIEEISRETALERLLPMVRDRLYFQSADRMMVATEKTPERVMRILNEELAAGLCIDMPNAMSTVNADQLASWNMTKDQAYRIAVDNLAKQSDKPFRAIAPGVFVSDFGDYHDIGRLMMPELFVRLDIRGEPVVAVPNRTVVLVTGSRDDAGLAMIAAMARKELDEPRPVSATLFKLDNFVWKPMLPPRSSPAFFTVKDAAAVSLTRRYAEQAQAMTEECERLGRDRFIATHTLIETNQFPVLFSWTTWVAGVNDASMPVTDLVAVGANPAEPAFALWADMMAASGHRLSATQDSPPRYDLTTWPTAEEIAQMNAMPLEKAIERLRDRAGESSGQPGAAG